MTSISIKSEGCLDSAFNSGTSPTSVTVLLPILSVFKVLIEVRSRALAKRQSNFLLAHKVFTDFKTPDFLACSEEIPSNRPKELTTRINASGCLQMCGGHVARIRGCSPLSKDCL